MPSTDSQEINMQYYNCYCSIHSVLSETSSLIEAEKNDLKACKAILDQLRDQIKKDEEKLKWNFDIGDLKAKVFR